MATVVKAPGKYEKIPERLTIFLGGVIDQGKASNWSKQVADELAEFDVLLLDPRRDNWDDTWEQTIEDEQFRTQVEWELEGQDTADLRLYVFGSTEEEAKKAKAPITFLELGLYARENCLVCCPEGFYRKGNIDITAKKYGVPVYPDLDTLLRDLKELLKTL